MKTKSAKATLSFAVVSLVAASLSGAVQASGHSISGLQDQYPAYDLNDTFLFLSDTHAVQEDHGPHRPDMDIDERRLTWTVQRRAGWCSRLPSCRFAANVSFNCVANNILF